MSVENLKSFEKLGVFYLGKKVDPDSGEMQNEYLLYDSADLTTHAVCVGMTGSGKTGLCVSILEEAFHRIFGDCRYWSVRRWRPILPACRFSS